MTPNEDDQTLRVEAQPKENCQLCLPDPPKVQNTGPSEDPRITVRELARLNQPELSSTAPPALFRQPSGEASGEDAECKVSERSCDPVARVSSCGQSSDPSARPKATGTSGQTDEVSAGPEAATGPKAAHPPCIMSQTQPDPEVVQNSTEPHLGTVSNDDKVPKAEKARRWEAGLCVACGEQKHVETGGRCLIGWTYTKPLKTSSPKSEPPTGPNKRSASTNGHSGGNDKRGRWFRGSDHSNSGSHKVGL